MSGALDFGLISLEVWVLLGFHHSKNMKKHTAAAISKIDIILRRLGGEEGAEVVATERVLHSELSVRTQ